VCAPDDGWRYHPKHVEQFPDINMIYLLTAIGLSPGGIYTQTIHRTTQITTEQHKKLLIWKSAGRVPSV